jgi:ATP/maltotriose-dependent transcriptional regulator MalT
VDRARITDQLSASAGQEPRLVLSAAPAGFGKPTPLAQWLAASEARRTVAWLSLDPGDAVPRLFLIRLVAGDSPERDVHLSDLHVKIDESVDRAYRTNYARCLDCYTTHMIATQARAATLALD